MPTWRWIAARFIFEKSFTRPRMKAQHRHELQANYLARWLEAKIEQVKPYTQAIVGVVIAAAVLIGVWMYLKHMDSSAEQAAADSLIAAINNQFDPIKAYQETIELHPGTPQATTARVLMGEQLLRMGSQQLYTNKPEGRANLGKAADLFNDVEANANDQMLRAWALYGLGRAHESLGELDRARGDFEKLTKEYPSSSLKPDAERHLTNLAKQSTKEFYDWFAKQDPRPTDPLEMNRQPGRPGQKPNFDLTDPTKMPDSDLKLPSAFDKSLTPDTAPPVGTSPGSSDATTPAAPSGESTSTPPAEPMPPADSTPDSKQPDSAPPVAPGK
jgi:tetratricopeptide (TPR) repeat protein